MLLRNADKLPDDTALHPRRGHSIMLWWSPMAQSNICNKFRQNRSPDSNAEKTEHTDGLVISWACYISFLWAEKVH
jgi:hypothetical protein